MTHTSPIANREAPYARAGKKPRRRRLSRPAITRAFSFGWVESVLSIKMETPGNCRISSERALNGLVAVSANTLIATVVVGTDSSADWHTKLDALGRLQTGWDGYCAPPPSDRAVSAARLFLDAMRREGSAPTRIAASSVGGVAITVGCGDRLVYVEFYNDGATCALFGLGKADAFIQDISSSVSSFRTVVRKMKDYVDE
jgi:hypothetical protein